MSDPKPPVPTEDRESIFDNHPCIVCGQFPYHNAIIHALDKRVAILEERVGDLDGLHK